MDNNTWEIWLSTGRTNGQYTLHRRLISRPVHAMAKEYTYVQNVGRTWERACRAANEWCDNFEAGGSWRCIRDFDESDERGSLRKPGEFDGDVEVIFFGKYKGLYVEDIIDKDPEYLKFVRDTFTPQKQRMKSFIEYLQNLNLGKSEKQERFERIQAEREARDAERAAKLATAPVITAGRQEITVKLLFCREESASFGYYAHSMVTKGLFESEDGNRYWGTLPSSVEGSLEELNDAKPVVTLRATIQPKDDDDHFAFFSRPHLIKVTGLDQEQAA